MTALQLIPDMERSATFSADRVFRYALRRIWDQDVAPVLFVAFNPSTADETEDDPTIRRCLGYAREWGYGGLLVGNIFAYRATNPKALPSTRPFPVGEPSTRHDGKKWRNDEEIAKMANQAAMVVAAWGAIQAPEGWEDRGHQVHRLLGNRAHALGRTGKGHPRHPLYVSRDARPCPLSVHQHEVRSCKTRGEAQWD